MSEHFLDEYEEALMFAKHIYVGSVARRVLSKEYRKLYEFKSLNISKARFYKVNDILLARWIVQRYWESVSIGCR